jgi:allantoinase
VAEAQRRGVDVSCETCPHYLVFTIEDMERLGAIAKCAPPLRTEAERETLWQHLRDGTLPMVASDHSPAPMHMKSDSNFFRVWGGISGCQSLLQVLLTDGHRQRTLPLTIVASATSEYVARRFRIPNKGQLAVGADADLVLVDLNHSSVLTIENLLYRHQHSPYVGKTMQGRIARTLVRGRTVIVNNTVVSKPIGRLITPQRQRAP